VAKKKSSKKKKLSKAELAQRRVQRRFKTDINAVMIAAGFVQIPTRNKTFVFRGAQVELDSLFLLGRVLVVSEDTCTRESEKIGTHLNKKAIAASKYRKYPQEFIETLAEVFPRLEDELEGSFELDDIDLRFMYCHRYPASPEKIDPHKKDFTFLGYRELCYFRQLSKAIKKSSKHELLNFLGLTLADLQLPGALQSRTYDCFVLRESPSGYAGRKVVTFYVPPKDLLESAYVLRRHSWRDADGLYQRLLVQSKLQEMRNYLGSEKRVFVNNVIVSLPKETTFLDLDDKPIDNPGSAETEAVSVSLPVEYNSIGIIDGQHRLLAYHEADDELEAKIRPLRDRQHLLVTGLVFPKSLTEQKRLMEEARLFLEINDKQKRTGSELRQIIEEIVNPFSALAVARSVLSGLGAKQPLGEFLSQHYFDDAPTIPTASIVSYALRHLVKFDATDESGSFFRHLTPQRRGRLNNGDLGSRGWYVEHVVDRLSAFLCGYRAAIVAKSQWTLDKKKSRALTTTAINGVLYAARLLVESGKFEPLYKAGRFETKLSSLNINFRPGKFPYMSSHWRGLGEKIHSQCF
jgi:DGQHR domain-containing protein